MESLERRFWAKVDKLKTPDGCWEWKAGKEHGYGRIGVHGKLILAHRLAWELTFGLIPEGLDCCHHCDNPACVNPAHLFLGTQSDNTVDAVIKGRQILPDNTGENNGQAKLTLAQVKEIRQAYIPYIVSQQSLANRYHVSRWAIQDILRGKHWR